MSALSVRLPTESAESDADLSDNCDAKPHADGNNGTLEILPDGKIATKPRPENSSKAQPQTQSINLAQLQDVVHAIQKAVSSEEARCLELCDTESKHLRMPADQRPKMNYYDLIEYHKSLQHAMYHLYLACQYRVADASLRCLPHRIDLPKRFWCNAIAKPMEILRSMLPESHKYLGEFIFHCFYITKLISETVTGFESVFECLGDLARCSIATAETAGQVQFCKDVATYWFNQALERNPCLGRLRHHLAVLSPRFSVEALALYGYALTAHEPFYPAHTTLQMNLHKFLDLKRRLHQTQSTFSIMFLQAHAALILGSPDARSW